MSKDKELSILIASETVETSAGLVVMRPFKFKDFPKAIGLINKYFQKITEADSSVEIVRAMLADAGVETLEDICALIELSCGKEPDFYQELTWDEVTNLLLIVVEQNIDFFNRIGSRLGSKFKKEEDNKVQATGQDGQLKLAA